jgi:hypothetical protein
MLKLMENFQKTMDATPASALMENPKVLLPRRGQKKRMLPVKHNRRPSKRPL